MIRRGWSKYYPDTVLVNSPDIFAVDSEIVDGLAYAVYEDHFVALRGHDVLFCPLREIRTLLSMCKVDAIRKEIKEIAEDMIVNERGEREYAKFRDKGIYDKENNI